jgi:hypothetical protein
MLNVNFSKCSAVSWYEQISSNETFRLLKRWQHTPQYIPCCWSLFFFLVILHLEVWWKSIFILCSFVNNPIIREESWGPFNKIFGHVQCRDLNFQRRIPWSFLCSILRFVDIGEWMAITISIKTNIILIKTD